MIYSDAYEVFSLMDLWNSFGPPSVDGVQELFEFRPEAAKHVGLGGKTLLHKCLEFYGDKLDLVQLLIDHFPDALLRTDDNGLLPIHTALMTTHYKNYNAVKLLVKSCPDVLIFQDECGRLPLHCACDSTFSRSQDTIQVLVDAFPDALEHPDNNGKYPLHYALARDLQFKAEPETINFLIERCPSVLSEIVPDAQGYLPLHSAVTASSASWVRTLQILAEQFPRALYLQTINQQTPLLLACTTEDAFQEYEFDDIFASSLSVIYALVRQWPEQVTSRRHLVFDGDDNGEVLHVSLASASIRFSRVEKWIKLHANEIDAVDHTHGRLVLHYAVVSKSPHILEIVKLLLSYLPTTALAHADRHGRIPLHYACAASGSTEMIDLLISGFPEGLRATDNDGRLPWHYAELANDDLGIFILDKTTEICPGLDIDHYLVPDEIRWDIVQASLDRID